jgi:hypothetical protein
VEPTVDALVGVRVRSGIREGLVKGAEYGPVD